MNNNYLLDTNIVIAYLNGDIPIRRHLKGVVSFVSVISAGELLLGAHKSNDRSRNLQATRGFLQLQNILFCNDATAEQYALVRADLEWRGERIPENDIWIAAHALQHNLTLVSRDDRFDRVTALTRVRW